MKTIFKILSSFSSLPRLIGERSWYREVILLRYYEGMKLKEVSSALGLSDGKLRTRLNKANEILRDWLKEWYYDEES